MQQSHATIYSKAGNTCPYCIRAKALLNQHSIPFTEYIIGTPGNSKEDIQKKLAGMGLNVAVKTAPQVFYTDSHSVEHYLGGFTDLQARVAILGT